MPPLIALFHGGGSSAYIMNVQCARLENALSKDFKFVYFDAPFKSPAGPGVLPAFRDQGPFRSWFKFLDGGFEGGIKDKMAEDGSGFDQAGNGRFRFHLIVSTMSDLISGRWFSFGHAAFESFGCRNRMKV